jgi:hypothetical protein
VADPLDAAAAADFGGDRRGILQGAVAAGSAWAATGTGTTSATGAAALSSTTGAVCAETEAAGTDPAIAASSVWPVAAPLGSPVGVACCALCPQAVSRTGAAASTVPRMNQAMRDEKGDFVVIFLSPIETCPCCSIQQRRIGFRFSGDGYFVSAAIQAARSTSRPSLSRRAST